MARPGLRPLGQVLVQLRMVWQRYRLMELSRAALRSPLRSSRESASHRYDCSRMAGPRYSSEFHQYEGHDVEQQAHRIHSYRPSSFLRSALLWRYSLPCGVGVSQWFAGGCKEGKRWKETYIRCGSVPLQVGLDGLVLLVEVRQVGHEVLDDVGVRQGVDLHLLGVGRYSAQAGEGVGAVDVHGAGAADALAAGAAEGEGRVDLVLDAHEGVEDHGARLVEVEGVRLHPGLLGGLVGVPSVDLERLHAGVVGALGVGLDGGIADRGHGAGEDGGGLDKGRSRGRGQEPRRGRAESCHFRAGVCGVREKKVTEEEKLETKEME